MVFFKVVDLIIWSHVNAGQLNDTIKLLFISYSTQKSCDTFHSWFLLQEHVPFPFVIYPVVNHPHCRTGMMWIYALREHVRLRAEKPKRNSNVEFLEFEPPNLHQRCKQAPQLTILNSCHDLKLCSFYMSLFSLCVLLWASI